MTLPPCFLEGIPPWRKKYSALTESYNIVKVPIASQNSTDRSRLSLREYAERCFSSCTTEREKDLMEIALKEKLGCLKQDVISTTDWSKEAIPSLDNLSPVNETARKKTCLSPKVASNLLRGNSIIGTSTSLEKSYFRLTAEPDPSTVRPEAVLKQSFNYILHKWEKERNVGYVIEQFKSIRQDISIQSIRNIFAIQVYEMNCDIALKCNQLDELVQCLGQLMMLYKVFPEETKDEFICYHMLYMLYAQNYSEYNILIRRNNLKSKTLCYCQFVSRALYETNCLNIIDALRTSPYSSALILKNICERFFNENLSLLQKAFKTNQDEITFSSLLSLQ